MTLLSFATSSYPEQIDQALLILWQQLGSHAHVQQYELGGGLNVEVISDPAPQAIRVCNPDQDVARMQVSICTFRSLGERKLLPP